MNRQLGKIVFSHIFLFILFAKMMISAMPALTTHFDSQSMNAVIMQLEIENNSSKNSSGKVLESTKGDWCDKILDFNFASAYLFLADKKHFIENESFVQPFYPSVPTPPPSV